MKVYCLTLPRLKERTKNIQQDWAGWDLELINGIDYLDCPSVGHDVFFALTCCFIGHMKIWERIAKTDDWSLVIENDSKPLPNINDAIESIKQCPYDLVKLIHCSTRQLRGIHHLKPEEWIGTSCYMIRNTKRLINEIWLSSPDAFLHKYCEPYGMFPCCAGFREGSKPSIPYKKTSNMMRKPDVYL